MHDVPARVHGPVSVETTEHGTYKARLRDPDRKQRSRTFKRKRAANDHLEKVHSEILAGTYIDARQGKVTVRAMADDWLTGAMNLQAR